MSPLSSCLLRTCFGEIAEGHLKLNNYLIKQGGFGNAIDMNIQLDDK
jgi:hypothetical protein